MMRMTPFLVSVTTILVHLLLMTKVCAQQEQDQQQSASLILEDCSICADGSVPPANYSTVAFAVSHQHAVACQELPTDAVTLYNMGLSNPEFVCQVSQLWAYEHCGCPTPPDVRPCWLCLDGVGAFDNTTWVPTSILQGAVEGSCQFQSYFSGLRYDHFGRASEQVELKCPYMTWGMDTWCGCPAETVTLPACTLCGDIAANKATSSQPCKRNPLAVLLHAGSSSAVVGPNFGTCQYYDWIAERLNEGQCIVFDEVVTRTIQWDGFDVKAFCCDTVEPVTRTAPEYYVPIFLCQDDTTTASALATTGNANKQIPALHGMTCAELADFAQYLTNETVLVQPWEDGQSSLRDYCCSQNNAEGENVNAEAATTTTTLGNHTCQPIPRAQYASSGSAHGLHISHHYSNAMTLWGAAVVLATYYLTWI